MISFTNNVLRIITGLIEKGKRISPRILFFAVLGIVVGYLFFDFLTKGYVMEGTYDRRDGNLPYHLIFLRAFQELELAQWNPYLFCGNTLFSSSLHSFFYPPNWILWSFPETSLPGLTTAILLVDVLLAGFIMRLLLLTIIRDEFWALCGTFAYLLSWSSMMLLAGYPDHYTLFIYLPAVLYLVITFDQRSAVSTFLLQTAAFALLLLSGSVQFNYYVVLFILVFALVRGASRDEVAGRRRFTVFWTTSASSVYALLISSVRYIPFYLSTHGNAALHAGAAQPAGYPPETMINLVLPGFYPGEVFLCYSGAFTFTLALYGMRYLWNRQSSFWIVSALAIILIALGTPVVYLHHFLTGGSGLVYGRLVLLVPPCMAVVAGLAGKAVVDDPFHRERFVRFSLALAGAVVLCAAGLSYYLPSDQTHLFSFRNIFSFLLLLAQTGLSRYLSVSKARSGVVLFKFLFALALLADLLFFATVYRAEANTRRPPFVPGPYYAYSPQEQALASRFRESGRNFRILGFSQGTSYARNVSLGLYSSSGYESVPPSYLTTLYSYPYRIDRSSGIYRHIGPQDSPIGQRAFELTSTRYVVEDEALYEVPQSLPRYSLYEEYQVIADDQEALDVLLGRTGHLDITRTVVLDRPPDRAVRATGNRGTLRVAREGQNDIAFEVATPENALLLLNDTYGPGWAASVDGERTVIIRANYAFRAVTVPAGSHIVRFWYREPGLNAALLISGGALAVFGVITAVWFVRTRRHRDPDA